MGLFGFGKKKNKTADTQKGNQQNENNIKCNNENSNENDNESGNENDRDSQVGAFIGFVLLSEPVLNKKQLAADLESEWGIKISVSEINSNDEKYKDIFLFKEKNMQIAVSLIPAPIPEEEVVHYARANYMWKDAVDVVKTHKAHIVVAILDDGTDLCQKGKMFTKVISSCLNQPNAIGVYSDGAVYEKSFFREAAAMAKNDGLPILNLVWFGIYRDEKQAGIYTYGLRKFGKEEIEVYVTPDNSDFSSVDLNGIRNFVLDIVSYVLNNNVVLRDGETIGFSAEQKLPITMSKGLALDGDTLKIKYCN